MERFGRRADVVHDFMYKFFVTAFLVMVLMWK